MSDLRAYIANCLVGGDTVTKMDNSWIRDTIEFKCDDQIFILKQKSSVITGKILDFNGRFNETSEILVRNVAESEMPKVLLAIDRICWLLSFAGLSRVLCYGHDYPDGSGKGRRLSSVGVTSYFRPTFEIRDGKIIKSFIEQAYPKFSSQEKSRKLNVVIDYLLQAERQNTPIECRLIFSFVLFENLKHTYAQTKHFPYIEGYFRESDKPSAKNLGFVMV